MIFSWAKVLPDGKNAAPNQTQIVHGIEYFFFRFTQPGHDARFSCYVACHNLPDYLQASLVLRSAANFRRKPSYSLQVVRDNFRSLIDHHLQVCSISAKVGNERFNGCTGADFSNFTNRSCPCSSTSIRQVVAVHRS